MLTLVRVWMPAWMQRLVQRLVRVLQVDVLADHRDVDLVLRVLQRVDELLPRREVGGAREDRSLWHTISSRPLLVQHHRDLVDRVDVAGRDHRLRRTLVKSAILRRSSSGSGRSVRQMQDVGLDADLAQLLHRVLRGLGLDLAGRRRCTAPASGGCSRRCCGPARGPSGGSPRGRAATRCRRRCRRSRRCRPRLLAGAALDARLDLVGDVRDHLHRAAEVVAAALLVDHRS